MKNSLLYRLIVFIIAFTVLFSLSSCSKSAGDSSDMQNESKDLQPVTLTMLTWEENEYQSAINELNQAFTDAYPYITIETKTISKAQYLTLQKTELATGLVDILTNDAFDMLPQQYTLGVPRPAWEKLVTDGTFYDLSDQLFLQNWSSEMLENAVSYDGKVYGLCIGGVGYNGVYYNKSIFEEYQFEEPKTWSEFIELCENLRTNSISPIILGGQDDWTINQMAVSAVVGASVDDMQSYAQGLWEDTRTFTDMESLKLWNRMGKFVSYLHADVMSVNQDIAREKFVDGQAAMFLDTTLNAEAIDSINSNFSYGYFLIPSDQVFVAKQFMGRYDMQFNISSDTSHIDECLLYFDFISQQENYEPFVSKLGFIPTMKDVVSTDSFISSITTDSYVFSPSWDKIIFAPHGVGEYAKEQCFRLNNLISLGGSVETIEELAEITQTDWNSKISAIRGN